MKILYATDGSEGALAPARFLASLPPDVNAHVSILTVVGPDQYDKGEDGEAALAAAKAALGNFTGHLTTSAVEGGSTGAIVDALLRTADDTDVDLIALGASGHSALTRFFLGSVAETVARYSKQSVLVARPPLSPLHDVIVGVDGSDCGQAAARFAASQIMLPQDCTLRLTGVVPQPYFGVVGDPFYPGTPDLDELERTSRGARNKAYRELEALAETLREARGSHPIKVEEVKVAHPAAELIRIADNHSAGLIIVGSKGLTGIERFLLGSVSEKVLRHAHCSVLIVK